MSKTQSITSSSKWLEKVHANNEILRKFVSEWHPSARNPKAIQKESVLLTDGSAVAIDVPESAMPITAPNAETACRQVRELIRKEEPSDPVARWDKAVASGDIGEILCLLDGAWFGVPESTSCWSIPGFKEAVDLMGDPPEQE